MSRRGSRMPCRHSTTQFKFPQHDCAGKMVNFLSSLNRADSCAKKETKWIIGSVDICHKKMVNECGTGETKMDRSEARNVDLNRRQTFPPLGLGHDIDRNLTDRDSRNKNIKREVMMAIDCGAWANLINGNLNLSPPPWWLTIQTAKHNAPRSRDEVRQARDRKIVFELLRDCVICQLLACLLHQLLPPGWCSKPILVGCQTSCRAYGSWRVLENLLGLH